MKNLEKYNTVFIEVFSVTEDKLNDDFTSENMAIWDSIRQLTLISEIEESFDIMFDTEDILGLTSYIIGKEMLATKYNINF
jgi:acyl carrier protein